MTIVERSIMQLNGPEGSIEFDVAPNREMVKMTVGSMTRTFKFIDLWALVFTLATVDQQEQMIPERRSEMVTYKRIHTIKVKKNLKAGDTIRCQCEINVEKTVVEGLKGMLDQNKIMTNRPGLPIIGGGKLSTM